MKTKLLTACAVLALSAGFAFAEPTPFPRGFNNLPDGHWIRGRGDAITMPYPARDNMWFDDFCKFEETTGDDWTITQVEAGASDSTEAVADADDCILAMTSDSNENDGTQIQSIGEVFTFTSGKEMYFETRLKIGDATQSDFHIGLQIRDTTASAVSDGVFFEKVDGSAALNLDSYVGSVEATASGLYTVVDDTYITISWYYDGGTSLVAAVDNVVVGTLTTTPTTTELTVSAGVLAGSGAADVLSVDYIYVWKER